MDVSHTPAACSFPGENARSWEALGEARPGQSSLSAGALRYRAWAARAGSPGPTHAAWAQRWFSRWCVLLLRTFGSSCSGPKTLVKKVQGPSSNLWPYPRL